MFANLYKYFFISDDLVKADVVPALIETITTSNDTYPVQALLSLMSNHPHAVKQACQNDTALREYITSTLSENDESEADREVSVSSFPLLLTLFHEFDSNSNNFIFNILIF